MRLLVILIGFVSCYSELLHDIEQDIEQSA